jgi:hypothetical protein
MERELQLAIQVALPILGPIIVTLLTVWLTERPDRSAHARHRI